MESSIFWNDSVDFEFTNNKMPCVTESKQRVVAEREIVFRF
jgi:hypothetical protein